MLLGGQPTSIPLPFNNCVVPPGINGPVAVFITSDVQPLINNVVNRAASQPVAGPLIFFIDTQTQVLGRVAGITSGSRSNSSSGDGSSSSNSTVTTQTISPAQASAIISGAIIAAASAPTSAPHPPC